MKNIEALEKRLWGKNFTKRLNWRGNSWRQNLRRATQNSDDISGIVYILLTFSSVGRFAVLGISVSSESIIGD